MTDITPEILYSVDRSGNPIAIIERKTEGGQQDVLAHYPGMLTGDMTTDLAKMVNHFAREFQYDVIDDPTAFAAAYRAQIANEDPNANWQQGNPRLRDFGMPDLDAITIPVLTGNKLTYYAKSVRLGVPYRVDVEIDGTKIGEAKYEPMKMGPIK